MPPNLHIRSQDILSIGITDSLLCLTKAKCDNFFSFFICLRVTGFFNDFFVFTSTATNFFVLSVGSV